MFKKIVVAYDGSTHSQSALDYAKSLAQTFDATLWLVHVVPHTLDLLGYDEHERLVARREGKGQAKLREAHRQLDDINLDVRDELLEAPEAEAILRVARTRKADLIVIGTHGYSALKGLLLGSVGQKVLHQAHCPVMVVR